MDELESSFIDFSIEDAPWDTDQLEEYIKKGVSLSEPLSQEDGRRPLHFAAKKGDINVVQILLDRGAYVDAPDYYGNIPSHFASSEGHIKVLELLIDRDANVNIRNDKGCTVLENAVCNGDVDIIRLLLSKGANVLDAESALVRAVEKENIQIIKELLKAGVKMKDNIMKNAVRKGYIELTRMVLESGIVIENNALSHVIPNNCEDIMNQCLFIALVTGQCEIARLLYEKGAEVNKHRLPKILNKTIEKGYIDTVKFILEMQTMFFESSESESSYLELPRSIDNYYEPKSLVEGPKDKPRNAFDKALHSAIICGNIEIIQSVLDGVTDVNIKTCNKTPLILATEKALIHVIKLLLEKGADIKLSDETGKTALHYALLQKDSFEIADILMDWGASVNDIICTETNTTPLHLAARAKNAALIEFLLRKDANVNAKDKFGNTPFHALFENKIYDDTNNLITCYTRLLEEGANPDCSNEQRETPIIKAVNSCSTDVLKIFLTAVFSIDRKKISSINSKLFLGDMILNGHISLLKLVLNEVADFHLEDVMKSNNISFVNEDWSESLKSMKDQNEANAIRLYYAAYSGNILMAEVALQNGAGVDVEYKGRLSPLQNALYKRNFEMVNFLINKGASLFVKDKYHLLPVQLAVILGNCVLVKKLCALYSKAKLRDLSVFGLPLLNLAAYHGNVNLVRFIWKQLSDINSRDENMNTVLHIAVKVQSNQLVDFCIDNGVDINAQNRFGDTAFHTILKVLNESKSIIDFEIALNLINRGIDINISNSKRKTPLHLATSQNLTHFIKILLEKGVQDIDARDDQYRTPFQQMVLNIKDGKSVYNDATDLVCLFLKYGASYVEHIEPEHTLIGTLLRNNSIEFERIVLEFCLKWDPQNYYYDEDFWYEEDMRTILRKVSREKKYNLLKLMLEKGFSFDQNLGLYESLFSFLFHNVCDNHMTKFIIDNDKTLEICPSYLFKAIENADLEIVQVLLDKLDVNAVGYGKQSTLQKALMLRDNQARKYGLAQFFLDKGVNVDNNSGCLNCVPLVEAAKGENWSMVNILLDKGANINALDWTKESILVKAVCQRRLNIVSSLLDKGAITNLYDKYGQTALHYAAFHGQSKITELLLEKGARMFSLCSRNSTPLHIAAERGHYEIVEILLTAGAVVSVKNDKGDTPLHKTKSFKVAEILISNGASVNDKNLWKQSPLHCLYNSSKSTENLKDITELLILSGAVVNEQDIGGFSPLHLAAKESNLESVSVLVSNGANLNVIDHKGWTPLHHAVKSDRSEIVEYLLEKGASSEVKNKDEDSPLLLASKMASTNSFLVLVKKGARINVKDRKGWTPLHHVVDKSSPELVEHLSNQAVFSKIENTPSLLVPGTEITDLILVLTRNGAKLDTKDHLGQTPLHYAVIQNKWGIVQRLLNHGASIELKNYRGETPLHLATWKTRTKALNVLIKNGAMLDATDSRGYTALHQAVEHDNSDAVVRLLLSGASTEVKNNRGETPLHLATWETRTKALNVLIKNGAMLDATDSRGYTALHQVVEHDNSDAVVRLLLSGASIEVKNNRGETPLHLATWKTRTKALNVLIENGAMLDATDSRGYTALHQAVEHDNSDAVVRLLLSGASTEVKNQDGRTPYQLYTRTLYRMKSLETKYFTSYLQLLKLAGLPIGENLISEMNVKDEEEAIRELGRISATELQKECNLIDLLSMNDRPSYLLGEGVLEQLNTLFHSPEFGVNFPIYGDILKSLVLKARRSKYYIKKRAIRSMMSGNRKPFCQVTPDLVWELVFGFLDLPDLTNVIKSEI